MPRRTFSTFSLQRACAGLVFATAACFPASAATVKTERIVVDPPSLQAAPAGTSQIPTGDLRPVPDEPDAAAAQSAPAASDDTPLPMINYGDHALPKPVQRIRAQMLEAATSGDIERLRPVLEANEVMPTLAFDSFDDPIAFLKESSGDPEGRELLAILTEVLEAGWVHVDVGTPQEMYVWPYFARYPLDKLDARQMVELFRIVTAGDLEDMKSYGTYIFYRVGIAPDGTWHYFVAGD